MRVCPSGSLLKNNVVALSEREAIAFACSQLVVGKKVPQLFEPDASRDVRSL
jgi:hypothetical protein